MRHPLAGFSGAADFDRSGIDDVDADFSSGNVVNATEDFGKYCMSGDFGMDYGEDHYQGGFEGYGHVDHFYGHDEGLGFTIKKPKIKVSAPKAVSKAVASVTKPVASVASSVIKPIASVAAPVAAVASPVTQMLAPIIPQAAQAVQVPFAPVKEVAKVTIPKVSIKKVGGFKLPSMKKPISSVSSSVVNEAAKIKKVGKMFPKSSQIQALVKKAVDTVAKTGLPVQAIAPVAAKKLPEQASVAPQYESQDVSTAVEILKQNEAVVSPEQARTSIPEVKVNGQFAHPLLFINRRMKGELMSGFFDDMVSKIKTEGQKVIDANKQKAVSALTTQASNVVGKQLDKLTKKDPKAAQAIQKVVATATETATAKAKEGLAETVKAAFEDNKKIIFAVGGGLLALVAFTMLRRKKA